MKEELRVGDYVLISHRDAGLPTYTWFWVKGTENGNRVVSPYFNSDKEAILWADNLPEWKE
jgi:hypothetical protein